MKPEVTRDRQQFIDDELMRLPMVADQIFDASWRGIQDSVPNLTLYERGLAGDLLQVRASVRFQIVDRFVGSVRAQVQAELVSGSPAVDAVASPRKGMLSLLDEDEIATDVETAHAVEAIRSVSEHELRELATYMSALAGDPDVARDYNPFRAQTYARALWDAVQVLPLGKIHQARLMRHASIPMAQVLRKSYAGACARLEDMGVVPAFHRTMILPAGARKLRPTDSWVGEAPPLNEVRALIETPDGSPPATSLASLDSLIEESDRALRALPADASPSAAAQLMESQRERMLRNARTPVDRQHIEMLTRLFEAILSDPRLSRDIRAVIARMQPSALRLVLQDDSALDDYTHPVWRFMDMIAHLSSLQVEGSGERDRVLYLCEQLIDMLAQEQAPDARLFRAALDRLVDDDCSRFEARVRRAEADIESMQALEDQALSAARNLQTGLGPLDEGQLDTVPAELLASLPSPKGQQPSGEAWLSDLRPGEWVRMYFQGEWQRAQLLWIGSRGDAFLFGREQTDDTIAMRRLALIRLHTEGLMRSLHPRSMLRSAAVQVLRASGKETGQTSY